VDRTPIHEFRSLHSTELSMKHHESMSRHRVILAFLLAPAAAPALIGLASIHSSMAGIWVIALGVAAFTYATTLIAGIPAYFVLRAKNWLKWWHFALGGAVLGLLPALFIGFPLSLQGILLLGPDHLLIGAVSGFAFWALAFAGSGSRLRGAA
jgi:hypothetical protein